MYQETINYVYSQLSKCTIATGVGRKQSLPMKSIPVDQPFQIVGVDIMEPPLIAIGNRCATVFQDLFTKWPIVYAESGQEAIRLAKLLVKEIVPMFGIPELIIAPPTFMSNARYLQIIRNQETQYHRSPSTV